MRLAGSLCARAGLGFVGRGLGLCINFLQSVNLCIYSGIPWCTNFEIYITSSRPVRLGIDTIPNRSQLKPSAPATTSMISWVISACLARFISSVRSVMISPAFSDALRIAVICAPKNPAADSTSAR